MDPAVERALVVRLRQGDAGAFDELYEWMRPRVYSFLARMTGRRDLADDLSQEVWLRLARFAPRLADDTRLGAWLFTVARNLYFSHWRAAQCALQLTDGLLPAQAAPPSPFEAACEGETSARVERAIAALPPVYREILLLCVVEGQSPKDAAAIQGISGEAARQRLARARAMIEAALGELARYPGGPS